jgi:hypothetical protein
LKKNPENFNISDNNIINVKAAKVVRYMHQGCVVHGFGCLDGGIQVCYLMETTLPLVSIHPQIVMGNMG